MNSPELQELFNSVFGWLDVDAVFWFFIGVGACLVLIGQVFVLIRPRAVGAALTALGLWMIPHAWVWYDRPFVMVETSFIVLAVSMAVVAALVRWTANKPTARRYALNLPLRMIAVGLTLLTVFHAVQYVFWKLQYEFSYLTFGIPVVLLVGVFCVAVGTVYALYARWRSKMLQQ